MGEKDKAPVQEEVPAEEEVPEEKKAPPKGDSKAAEGKKYSGGPIPRS